MKEGFTEGGLRDRLIIAGIEEISLYGIKDFSLRRVAMRCNASCAAPYRHFKNREDFIRAIGAEPVVYGMRNECCGGYVTLENKGEAEKRSNAVLESAKAKGADTVVTACPLCLYNLKKNGGCEDVSVVYFTELLAEALGVK